MKSFLKKFFLFFTLLLSYFLLIGGYNVYRISQMNPSAERNLILGDSHAKNSFDLSVLKGWENKGSEGEPYTITYLKLKFELDKKEIDSIIISFGFHNISGFNDNKLRDRRANLQFENNPELFISLRDDWLEMPINRNRMYKALMKKILLMPFEFYGSDSNHELSSRIINKKDDVDKSIERHFTIESKIAGISIMNKTYLEKLIELALSKNIKVVLLNTPLHRDYLNKIPPQFIKEYNRYTSYLTGKYDILYMDYSNLKLSQNQYRDFDHLNKNGAKIFTKRLIHQWNRE